MAGTSLYGIAEIIKNRLQKGDAQVYISDVRDAYAFLVKAQWYENQKSDCHEIDGQFIVSFGGKDSVLPSFDSTMNMYYVDSPSSYVSLPAESGIVYFGYLKDQTFPFVRTTAGTFGRLSRIKAGVMGGRKYYYQEGERFYLPNMQEINVSEILIKLAVALDDMDVDKELSIPRNIVGQIVDIVVQKYIPTPEKVGDKS